MVEKPARLETNRNHVHTPPVTPIEVGSLWPGQHAPPPPPPGSVVPLLPMVREADPPARTIPHFPIETVPWTHQAILPDTGHPGQQPTSPAVETETKCPPGSIGLPHTPDDHTRNTPSPAPPPIPGSVPTSPETAQLVATTLQRPEAPSHLPDCLPEQPVSAVQSERTVSPKKRLVILTICNNDTKMNCHCKLLVSSLVVV